MLRNDFDGNIPSFIGEGSAAVSSPRRVWRTSTACIAAGVESSFATTVPLMGRDGQEKRRRMKSEWMPTRWDVETPAGRRPLLCRSFSSAAAVAVAGVGDKREGLFGLATVLLLPPVRLFQYIAH